MGGFSENRFLFVYRKLKNFITKVIQFSVVFSVTTVLTFGGWHFEFQIGEKKFSMTRTVNVALAATEGPNFPSASGDCVEVAGPGTISWTSPGNAFSDNATVATVSLDDGQISEYLYCSNFGFSVPSGSTIDGIEVFIEQRANSNSRIDDGEVYLATSTSPNGSQDKATTNTWTTTETTVTYPASGGNTDTWNVTWGAGSGNDVNSSGFGVIMSAEKPGSAANAFDAEVDSISITVHYTTESDSPTPNPPYFTAVPNATTSSAAGMTSVTGSDVSTPIEYFFTATSSSCTAGHYGTGNDSGWIQNVNYYDSGLSANKCYGYLVTMRDAVDNYTSTSTASSTYTRAAVPGGVTYSNVGVTSLTIDNSENGNSALNPTTDFLIYATSTDANWNGFYVDSSGATSSTEVWITDAQADALAPFVGLQQGTFYYFSAVARNEDGIRTATSTITSTTTVPDTFAPTPDPATFSTPPGDLNTSSIDMAATVGSDDTGPIDYYFTNDDSACHATDQGGNGSDRTWTTSDTTYTDSGLSVNKCYGYAITMRDSLGNDGATSSASIAYTSANPALTPVLSGETDTTLELSNTENSNPASTTFLIRIASSTPADATWEGKYVDGSGNPSDTEVWMKDATIETITVTDLNFSTTYSFEAVSRNGDGDRTATSSLGDGSTTADSTPPTPDPLTFVDPTGLPNNDATGQITMQSETASDPTPTVNYYFATTTGTCGADLGPEGTDSGWQASDTYTDDTSISPNKCYAYTITARDGNSNETTASAASSTYSSAAVPNTPTLSNPTETTLDITNNENGNPSSNPTTDFLVYIASSTPNDAGKVGEYVTAAGGSQASEVWLTDAQIDGLTITGLTGVTTYSFEIVARNADGDRAATSTWGDGLTGDDTPPAPNPPVFSTTPNNVSTSQIDMVISASTDISTVEYYVTATSSTCTTNHEGTGGSDTSDWQSGTSHSDDSLQVNKCYGYLITARDSAGNYTSTSTASSTYTSAAVASAPTLSAPTETTLTITNNENGNPSSNPTTDFLVYIASSTPNDAGKVGEYVTAAGGSQASETWLTDAQIDSLVVTGLTGLTIYSFEVVARNADGDRAATSSDGDGTTTDQSAPTPNPPLFEVTPTNDSDTAISATATAATDPSTPIEYFFSAVTGSCGADVGTGGTDSGWLSADREYTDTGLQANKCYGYTLTVRDSLGNDTATSAASSTYSSAATPGQPSSDGATVSTIDISNDENGNPASNPATTFAVQVVSSAPSDSNWNSQYVDTDGTPSASAIWMTDATIEALSTANMATDTAYTIRVKARNADNDETAFGTSAILSTTPEPRPPIIRLEGMRLRGARIR